MLCQEMCYCWWFGNPAITSCYLWNLLETWDMGYSPISNWWSPDSFHRAVRSSSHHPTTLCWNNQAAKVNFFGRGVGWTQPFSPWFLWDLLKVPEVSRPTNTLQFPSYPSFSWTPPPIPQEVCDQKEQSTSQLHYLVSFGPRIVVSFSPIWSPSS